MAKKVFYCFVPGWNNRESADVVEAWDDEEAAEIYCARYHDGCAEYPDLTTVAVWEDVDQPVKMFDVTWEAVRNYTAEQKEG